MIRRALAIATVAAVMGAGSAAAQRRRSVRPRRQLPPVGVMLPAASNDPTGAAAFLSTLRVGYYRPLAIVLDQPLACPECAAAAARGLAVVLSVRASGGGVSPSGPPTDLNAFRSKLGVVLDTFQPALLVVENEENSSLFYSGTPAEYHIELRAACEVAHAHGLHCTDGGLVSRAIAALAVQDYLDRNREEDALSLAQRTLGVPLPSVSALRSYLEDNSAQLVRSGALLSGFRGDGVDYVNFHWYESDARALVEVVDFVRRQNTALPVITNEIGQRNDDPTETQEKLEAIRQLGLPIAVWFSGDGPKARALTNPDWSLRPSGEAFRLFLENWR